MKASQNLGTQASMSFKTINLTHCNAIGETQDNIFEFKFPQLQGRNTAALPIYTSCNSVAQKIFERFFWNQIGFSIVKNPQRVAQTTIQQ